MIDSYILEYLQGLLIAQFILSSAPMIFVYRIHGFVMETRIVKTQVTSMDVKVM